MQKELISVIIPIYNVEEYLDRCIESVVNQTYKNLEIILVDDGSPDSCPKKCDEWAKRDSRIVVIHKKNGGLSDARNAGLDTMNGEYVTFIDSDDYVDKEYVNVLYNNLINNGVEISQVEFYNEQENIEMTDNDEIVTVISTNKAIENYYLSLFPKMNISSCAKLYSKTVIGDFRFPIGKTHEDQYFTPQVAINSKNIALSNKKLYCYVNRDNSIMHVGFNEKRWDNIWAVDKCIEKYKKIDMGLIAPATHYKKKTIAKFNVCARASYVHKYIPKQYKMNIVFAKIIYFFYMSKFEKRDALLNPLVKIKNLITK